MRYEIKLEKLLEKGATNQAASSAGIKEIADKIIKNIQELYVTRADILTKITGEGKGEEARSFFGFLQHAEVPAIDFTGRQPLIRHLH